MLTVVTRGDFVLQDDLAALIKLVADLEGVFRSPRVVSERIRCQDGCPVAHAQSQMLINSGGTIKAFVK